ncbi:MAG: biopolymer transporter ExbD [Gammaproteobacteria bacterium]|nr:biopolymer transporter ExbD [Gammaproteobacteria bacterium]
MNLRRTRRDEPELNLIPLVDILFVVLIFFIVTTTFNRDAGITLTLPEASAGAEAKQDTTLGIVIDAEGRYYINQQQVVNTSPETLKRALQQVAAELHDAPVVISADAKTPHQAVITAMDVARQLGFVHITLATQNPQQTKP